MGSLVKSVSYIIGMIILAPIVLNKIGKAVDSDIKFKFDFYEIAKGAKWKVYDFYSQLLIILYYLFYFNLWIVLKNNKNLINKIN